MQCTFTNNKDFDSTSNFSNFSCSIGRGGFCQSLIVKDNLEDSLPLCLPTTLPSPSAHFNVWAAVKKPEHKLGGDPPNSLDIFHQVQSCSRKPVVCAKVKGVNLPICGGIKAERSYDCVGWDVPGVKMPTSNLRQ